MRTARSNSRTTRRPNTAYAQVLAVTPESDESHASFVDNLAASIYKQGELANEAEDYRAAADHFLRIRSAAPTSSIRPTAEYDAGAALIKLQDWTAAVQVLEAFRSTFPEHKLQLEASKQIAYAYRQSGQLARAAGEYDSIASKSTDPALRSEALLTAGELYEQSNSRDRALASYIRYVNEFPKPVEPAVETRFKIAEMYKAAHDEVGLSQRTRGKSYGSMPTPDPKEPAGRGRLRPVRHWYSQSSSTRISLS